MNAKWLPLLLLSTLIMPLAAAQGPATGVTLSGPDEARTLTPGETTTLTYTITVACAEFLSAQETSLTFDLEADLPAGYGAEGGSVDIAAGQDCITSLPGSTVEGTVDLSLTPTMAPLAYQGTSFTATATSGDLTASDKHDEKVTITYVGGHTMETSIGFPFEYTGNESTVTFDVMLEIGANGKTMVMFENVGARGGLNGLFHQTFDVAAGQTSRSLNVTWTPPTGAWTEDTITFHTYSHSLDGSPDPYNEQDVNWTIVNMAPATDGGDDDGEDSPSAPVVLLAIGLVAVALIARRRS